MEVFIGFLLVVYLQLIGSVPSVAMCSACSKVRKKLVFPPAQHEGVRGLEFQLLSF